MTTENQHNDFEALCAAFVLGALSPDEKAAFEARLKSASAEELRLLEELQAVNSELALTAPVESPSPQVHDRILKSISTEKKEANIIPLWVYRAAAAVLLIGMITFAFNNLQLSDTVRDLTVSVEEKESRIFRLENELERKTELLSILESREVSLILMAGLDVNPEGYGKIIWDPENEQALLQIANLPAPPDDKDYQLWFIKESQSPISAGVFNFEQPSTDLFFKIEQLSEQPSPVANAFAITMEPKGGMPQPTGDMFLLGSRN
jgi:anti-sigma-K factor RskA